MPDRTAMDRVKLMVGMEPETPPELMDEINDCFALSRMQRLYGFGICIRYAELSKNCP